MDSFKKKISRKQRLIRERERERGAILLEDVIKCCDGKSNPIIFFSAYQIIKATDNFSEANHVHILSVKSNLIDNIWYSGKSEKHPMLLIKKIGLFDRYYHREYFSRDISISSMVSGHKNFLKLVGCCIESEIPAMVYDGVKKHYRLHLSEQPWKRRMKIAEDIAIALAYLHTAFPRPFVYSCLSLENILLDEDGVAKVINFPFCILIPQGETFVQVDRLAIVYGYGYLNYNYEKIKWLVSEKTDVLAIGIVMQKLLAGEERFQELCDCGTNEECEGGSYDYGTISEGRMEEITDPKMIEEMGEISEEELCRMKAFLMLSRRCIGLTGEVPTMVEVAKELRKIQRSIKPYYARDISSSFLSNKT